MCDVLVKHNTHSEQEPGREVGGVGHSLLLYRPSSSPTLHTSEQSQHLLQDGGSEVRAGTQVQLRSLRAAAQPTVFILSWGPSLGVGDGVDT